MKEKIQKDNIKNTLFGDLLLALSAVMLSYMLPYYLKSEGLGILEIGALFTIGLAFGSLIVGMGFSRVLRKIKLKTGLVLSSVLMFLQSFILFLSPASFFVLISKFTNIIEVTVFGVSKDVSLQHNSNKKNHRKVGEYSLIFNSLGIVGGLVLAIILVPFVGWKFSFLIFSLIGLSSLLFFKNVNDDTRFKLNGSKKIPKLSGVLKWILFSEILYYFALGASFALVITFLVEDNFGGSFQWIALMFIALYFSIMITTLLTRRHLNKMNLLKSSLLGMSVLFLSALVVILSKNLYMVLFAMILEGIGAGVWVPSITAVRWGLIKNESREIVAGYLTGWRRFMSSLGPLAGGLLVVHFGILGPFYLKAVFSFVVMSIYFVLYKKLKERIK